jgi:RecA-family ATPase
MSAPKKSSTIGEVIEETKRAFAKPLTRELSPKRRGPPPPPLPAAPTGVGAPPGGAALVDMLEEDGPLSYLVKRLAMTDGGGAPHMIAGSGFSGKSVLCQDLLLALSSGTAVFGSLRALPRRVMHIDLEQGTRLTRRRYRRLARARGIDLVALQATGRLAVSCLPALRLHPDDRAKWFAIMQGRDLLLIDSLRVAAAGLDENKSGFRDAIDFLTSLSEETSCRALLIHHVRKRGKEDAGRLHEKLRGSSAIFEALDCVWILNGEDGEDEKEFVNAKARTNGETVAPLVFSILDVHGEGDVKWGLKTHVTAIDKLLDRRRALATAKLAQEDRDNVALAVATLREHPGLTIEQLGIRMHRRRTVAELAVMNAGDAITATVEAAGKTGGRPRTIYGAL